MSTGPDPVDQEPRRGCRGRWLVYILASGAALISYVSAKSVWGTLPAIGVVAIVVLLLITNLSNVEQGLDVVRRDIPVVWDAIRQIKLRPFVKDVLNTSYLVLFRHTKFIHMAQRDRVFTFYQRLVIMVAVITPLFLNLCILSFILGGIYKSDLYIFFAGLILLLIYILYGNKHPSSSGRNSHFLMINWLGFLISLSWFIHVLFFKNTFDGSAAFVAFIAGGILGFFNAFAVEIPKKTNWFVGFIILYVFAYFLVNNLGYSWGPPIMGDSNVISALDTIGGYVSSTEVSEFIAVNLTVIPFSFVGYMIGYKTIVLYLIELPVYAISYVYLGKTTWAFDVLTRIMAFDDWRVVRLPGEGICYARLIESEPERVPELLIPEILYTPRCDSALGHMVAFLNAAPDRVTESALVNLLPFDRYEASTPWLKPRMSRIASVCDDRISQALSDHRRSLFREIDAKKEISGCHRYPLLLSALDRLARSEWATSSGSEDDARQIRVGLLVYEDIPEVKPLYVMAQALEASFQVRRIQDIGLTSSIWDALISELSDPMAPSSKIVAGLSSLAHSLRDFNGDASQLTLPALCVLRLERLLNSIQDDPVIFAVRPLRMVFTYWSGLIAEEIGVLPGT